MGRPDVETVFEGVPSSTGAADREAYSRDLWPRQLLRLRRGERPRGPAAVVWPRNLAEVVRIVGRARDEGIVLVPFGAGSGVCGGIDPEAESVVLDLKRLNRYQLLREGPALSVGAGALGITLEEDLDRLGFTIGHFPSSILCSTVGGWVAARGAGQCSGLYGKIEDMVAELECVLGTGEVVHLKRRAHGLDLTPLMIGSEGTLGVITRAVLRLHERPAARGFLAFEFRSTEAGWDAMRLLFQAGLRPAVSRLYDPVDSFILAQGAVKKPRQKTGPGPASAGPLGKGGRLLGKALARPRLLNRLIEAAEGNLLGGARLVLVFEGASEAAAEDSERARRLCLEAGGKNLGEGPARAWLEHRYSVSYRQSPVFRMGAFSDTMEVSASWRNLKPLYDGVRRALGSRVLVMAHLSHAYPDGCSIYFTFSGVAEDDTRALEKYDAAWRDALDAAIEAGGCLSHHHGVGRSKAPRLGPELGLGVELVRRLQLACDPEGILNAGNLVPRDDSSADDRSRAEAVGRPAPGLDAHSQLYTALGEHPMRAIEAQLAARGFTLGVELADAELKLSDWIARGCPGAPDPFEDPVRQTLSGLTCRLRDGQRLVIRPAPRRAVGPDLVALFRGAGGRVGEVEQATLSVRAASASPARPLPFDWERDPPIDDAEQRLFERISEQLTAPA